MASKKYGRSGSKLRLLVVDDEEDTLEFLKELLHEDYDVDIARCATDAMAMIREEHYEVVVADYQMPGENGISLTKRIKQFDPGLPVLLMSGMDSEDVTLRALRAKVFDYIDKPFDQSTIEGALERALVFKDQERERRRLVRIAHEKEIRLKLVQEQNEALQKAMLELSNARSKLIESEKLASIGVLAAGIAHELNNPLAIIMGMTHLIHRDPSSTEATIKKSEKILDAAERMKKIIQQMRHKSREEKEEDWAEFNLNDAIRDSLVLVREQLHLSDIDVKLDLSPSLPAMFGNTVGIQSILQNLILNSKDAFQNVEDRQKRISIRTYEKEACVVSFTYEDNAAGIPEDVLPKIFDPFFTTKDVNSGTGLGMYLTYNIVKEHRGEVRAESVIDQGTTFTFQLPVLKEKEDLRPPIRSTITIRKPRVLIIEDEAYIIDYLREVLEDDCEIHTHVNPNLALAEFSSVIFDLVLIDAILPDISGIDLLKKIKSKAPNVPVIMTTGHSKSDREMSDAHALGAAEILTKPFGSPEDLKGTLLKYLGHFDSIKKVS